MYSLIYDFNNIKILFFKNDNKGTEFHKIN